MNIVRSADGTTIAYGKHTGGPALILVDGAICTRSTGSKPELARLLAAHFTVYCYDRRGRGESGDSQPYAVEREIEDVAALIDTAGGTACLYGHSSEGSLALETTVALGTPITKLAMYEPPYNDDPDARKAWETYISQLTQALPANRRGDAVALFMAYTGVAADQIEQMRNAPIWPDMEAIAPTLRYDHAAILGKDASVPVQRAAQAEVPTLVMHGGASYPFMAETARALRQAIPHAQLRTLTGQSHVVSPEVLAPVLVEFFTS
ncbi:MAG TPA: alpha/beta hydrolase [Streptosporangiaceae bacterium]